MATAAVASSSMESTLTAVSQQSWESHDIISCVTSGPQHRSTSVGTPVVANKTNVKIRIEMGRFTGQYYGLLVLFVPINHVLFHGMKIVWQIDR